MNNFIKHVFDRNSLKYLGIFGFRPYIDFIIANKITPDFLITIWIGTIFQIFQIKFLIFKLVIFIIIIIIIISSLVNNEYNKKDI